MEMLSKGLDDVVVGPRRYLIESGGIKESVNRIVWLKRECDV